MSTIIVYFLYIQIILKNITNVLLLLIRSLKSWKKSCVLNLLFAGFLAVTNSIGDATI